MPDHNVSTRRTRQIVVVLDDDELLLTMVSRLLRKTEHELHCFSTPTACTAGLQKIRADKLFIDHRLPEISGIDYCQQLHDAAMLETSDCYLWSATELPRDIANAAEALGIVVLSKDILRTRSVFLDTLELP